MDNIISNLEIRSKAVIASNAFNNNKLPSNQVFIYKRNRDGSINNTTMVSCVGINRTSIVTPSNITTIGDHSFGYNSISNITIPSTVTTIYKDAFYGNYSKMNITVNNNSNNVNITAGAFPTDANINYQP